MTRERARSRLDGDAREEARTRLSAYVIAVAAAAAVVGRATPAISSLPSHVVWPMDCGIAFVDAGGNITEPVTIGSSAWPMAANRLPQRGETQSVRVRGRLFQLLGGVWRQRVVDVWLRGVAYDFSSPLVWTRPDGSTQPTAASSFDVDEHGTFRVGFDFRWSPNRYGAPPARTFAFAPGACRL